MYWKVNFDNNSRIFKWIFLSQLLHRDWCLTVTKSWKEKAKNKKEKEMTMSVSFFIMHQVKSEMSQGEIRASYKRYGNTSQLIVNLTVSPWFNLFTSSHLIWKMSGLSRYSYPSFDRYFKLEMVTRKTEIICFNTLINEDVRTFEK